MNKENNSKYTGLEIAVIGLSGKFPGTNDIQEFWHNLIEGKELIRFFTEEELFLKGLNSEEIKHEKFIPAHGEMNEVDNFDASFFNYLPDEAKLMDPQIRIYHQCVWHALEDSGYNPESFLGRIGLFSGASENITWKAYAMLNASNSETHNFSIDQLSNKDFLSTLVSYKLNLKGPSINISTACSTSLVAIHTAIRSLLTGECEMAVAGGVSFTSNIKKGYIHEEGMISSVDGHCRTFDEKSSGTVSGDGAGVVVLKKLKDAIRDNDNIYAIVKGSSVNNDGLRKVGYTSPSVEGQMECIKLAHKISRVSADSISYIEAHGTATALGDPIEIEALNNAFNNDIKKSCGIGSVKTNIGHLDVAAGVAGFIKVVLALHNKKIPKSLHFNRPNKNITFDDGPFYIIDELKEWEIKNEMPLRAGVSSFGIGGTNAHVILEEAPKVNKESSVLPYNLVTLSAKNEKSLDQLVIKFENYLLKSSESLENMAYTLNCGRKDFSFRKSFVTNDLGVLKKDIKAKQPINYSQNFYSGEFNPIVFMFSGQGTQYLNMSKELYESYNQFKNIMDNGFEILNKISKGKDFKKILFNDDDSVELLLSRTDNTQPLLFLVEYSLASYLINLGIEPQYIIGHSLGEYVGACISNVFSFEDGLFMLYHRGRLMNALPEGDMLSAVISENKAKELISNDIDLAAVNSEDQCVFSGSKEAIEKLNNKLNELEITNKIIDTSHAFHSTLMAPMLKEFEDICKQVHFNSPKFKIISNISGEIISDQEINKHTYWRDHIISPVMFNKGMNTFFSDNKNKIFIEIGPGSTLLNLVSQNVRNKELIKAKIPSLPNKRSTSSSCLTLVRLLENLWQLGKQINWEYYYKDKEVFKLSLPTYPFLKNKYPAEVDPFSNFNELVNIIPKKESVLNSFYQQTWTNVMYPECNINDTDDSGYLLFAVEQIVFDEIKELLKKRDTPYVEISLGNKFKKVSKYNYQVCGTELKELNDLFNELKKDNISYTKIVYGWGLSNDVSENLFVDDIISQNQFKSFDFLKILNLAKSLENQNVNSNIKLAYLSNNFQQILPGEKSNYKYATSIGLLKSFSMENDFVDSFSIDIDNEGNYAQPILNELHNEEFNFNIAYRNKTRWIQDYKKISLNSNFKPSLEVVKKDGVYIITGGLGNAGRVFCDYLTSNFNATVVLLGRSSLPEFSDWDRLINTPSTSETTREKLRFLIYMKNLNYKVEYHHVDISDVASLGAFIAKTEEKYVRINGVIHAAGILKIEECYKNILNTDLEFMLPHFKSKTFGLLNLYEIFKGKNLDFVWTTTSLSTVVGGHSLGAYLASNLYTDYFISSIEEYEPNWKAVDLDGLEFEAEKSENKITKADLIKIFNISLNIKEKSRLIVSMTDLHAKIELTDKRVKDLEENKSKDHGNENNDRSSIQTKYIKPDSETEKRLTGLWEKFFGMNKIGVEDSFFELGGDSLKSMTIIKRMFKEFNVDIALQDFIEKGTIRQLSLEIDLAVKLKEISENSIEEGDFNEMVI